MANTDRPRGFWPLGTIKNTVVMVAGSATVKGEFVVLASDGKIDAASAGGDILGLALQNAATDASILVSVAPEQIYVGQSSATEIDAQTDIGNVVDIIATAQNTTYDVARHEIDSTTLSTSSGQLLILGIDARPDNVFGANVDVRCKIAEHQAFGTDNFAGI